MGVLKRLLFDTKYARPLASEEMRQRGSCHTFFKRAENVRPSHTLLPMKVSQLSLMPVSIVNAGGSRHEDFVHLIDHLVMSDSSS
jgi:hypothetical protein